MSDSLFPFFLMSDVSELLTVAHQKRAMGANRSGRSPKLSDHEWFAQVTHQKWATISESLGSLTKNEGVSELLVFWANQSFAHFFRIKRAIRSENRWANSQPCLLCKFFPSFTSSMQIFPFCNPYYANSFILPPLLQYTNSFILLPLLCFFNHLFI